MAKVGEGRLQIDDGRVNALEIFTEAPTFCDEDALDSVFLRGLMFEAENLSMRRELTHELSRIEQYPEKGEEDEA
jgi:hypothetical protein